MSNFLEITSNDNWFKQHPEKIAGVEYETTSFYFPIMVKGTKEDVLRVTGMSSELDKKFENKKAFYQQYVGNQSDQSKEKQKRIRIANANAKARLQLLSFGLTGISVSTAMSAEDIEFMMPYNKQIVNAMKKGYAPDKIFHFGKPFGELAKHIPDYKIEMTGKVLTKSMSKDKDHQLNWANFIDLPFFLNNPTAIFKSETIGYVVLTEVYDVNDKPVMISLHINKKYFITNIASLYVRNYNTYKRWINENLHLYINEKSDLFDGTQATIAVGSNKSQYKDIKK